MPVETVISGVAILVGLLIWSNGKSKCECHTCKDRDLD